MADRLQLVPLIEISDRSWRFVGPPQNRCYNCTEVGRCPLAKKSPDSDVPVMKCRGCKSNSLAIRKLDRGFSLGCRAWPACKGALRDPDPNPDLHPGAPELHLVSRLASREGMGASSLKL